MDAILRQCRVLDLMDEYCLALPASFFRHSTGSRWTWRHPQGSVAALDHILISEKWKQLVTDCKVFGGMVCGSDHRPLVASLRLRFRSRKPTEKVKRFDVSRFGDEMCAQDFDKAVAAKYHQLPAEPREQNLEAEWGELRTALTSAAEEHLGPRPKGIQSDLQSSETADVVECRRKAFTEANSRLSKKQTGVAQHNSKVNLVYKSDTDRLWSERAREVEKASAEGNTQQQYALIRHHTRSGVVGPPIPEEKWKEHYSKLYDHQPEPFILEGPAFDTPLEDLTEEEVDNACTRLKMNRACGCDDIPAEVYRYSAMARLWLFRIIMIIWRLCILPIDWGMSIIIPILKPHKDPSGPTGYRGISLLVTAYKIYARCVYERLKGYVFNIAGPTQAGFTPGRSTADNICAVKQLIERATEFNRPIYLVAIDFTTAFDFVSRDAIWRILLNFGTPESLVKRAKCIYSACHAKVRTRFGTTAEFEVRGGVRQGCCLSPALFLVAIGWLAHTLNNLFSGHLWHLEYADDMILASHDLDTLQKALDLLAEEGRSLGLVIHPGKTQAMACGRGDPTPSRSLQCSGVHVKWVKHMVYLGAVLTPQNSARDEVNRRTAGAGHSYRQLQRFVFNNPEISAATKLRVFQTMVMPVLLYCMHLVPLRKSDQRRLDSWFHTRVRWILGIRWEEKITNQEVRHRATAMLGQFLCPPSAQLRQLRLRAFGHFARHDGIAHSAMIYIPEGAKRPRGRPHMRWWRDVIPKDIEELGFPKPSAEEAFMWAQSREDWRLICSTLANTD